MKEAGERLESNISVATVHHNFCPAAVEGNSVSLSSIGRDPVNSRQSIKALTWRMTVDLKVPELVHVSHSLESYEPGVNYCAVEDEHDGEGKGGESDGGRWRTAMDSPSLWLRKMKTQASFPNSVGNCDRESEVTAPADIRSSPRNKPNLRSGNQPSPPDSALPWPKIQMSMSDGGLDPTVLLREKRDTRESVYVQVCMCVCYIYFAIFRAELEQGDVLLP